MVDIASVSQILLDVNVRSAHLELMAFPPMAVKHVIVTVLDRRTTNVNR